MDRPILVSAPLIKPILSGEKTLTSRLAGLDHVNKDPDNYTLVGIGDLLMEPRLVATFQNLSDDEQCDIYCPYGGLGSMLWVRENWYVSKGYDGRKPSELETGGHILCGYVADGDKPGWGGKTRASIHMPRHLSRISLMLSGLSCDRLQEISEIDAGKEGVPRVWIQPETAGLHEVNPTYYDGFKKTWIEINGRENWDLNPWVWRLFFKLAKVKYEPSNPKSRLQ
jgi:hypothetical protein